MNRLNYFQQFNESDDSDTPQGNPFSPLYFDASDGSVFFELYTSSGMNSLAVKDEAKMFTLTTSNGKQITLTYEALVPNKQLIVSLENSATEGEALYKWILRVLSLTEFDKQPDVSKWTTFEALQNDELSEDNDSAISYRYYFNDECYRIVVNPETNTIITYFAPRVVAIKAELFYSANTGLIDLHDGKIEEFFRSALDSSGIDMRLITKSKEDYLMERTKKIMDISQETDKKEIAMFNQDRYNEYLSDLMSNSEALRERALKRLEETTRRYNK